MNGTERQNEAITRHDRSLVVSAGAGTGKTFVLVNKYMNLLETFGEHLNNPSERISVLNILALTFTEKAAAEMKERIRGEMEKKDGKFWEKTRLEFLIAPVQTFHSFCSGVLREFAFDANLDPSFTVLDEREMSRILADSFQDLIHQQAEPHIQNALVITLSLAGNHTLEKMIRYLYAHRDEADQILNQVKTDTNQVISRWQDEICIYKEKEVCNLKNNPVFQDTISSLLSYAQMNVAAEDKAMGYLQKIRPYLETLLRPGTTADFIKATGSCLNEKLGNAGSKKEWGEERLRDLKENNRILKEFLKNIHSLAMMEVKSGEPFSDLTIRFLQALGIVFNTYCTIVDREKSEIGGIDFTDLIRHTRHLFRKKRDLVVSYYAERYRFILIDEFQDTDQAQFEIITAIIGEPSPDVQGLFIVGDPKQSIYLFRDADVTRFRDAENLITGACAGKNISLDISFRSSPAVIDFTNFIFSRLFSTAEKPWECTYDTIRVSDERVDHRGSVSLMLIPKDGGISEYDAVADQIKKITSNGTEVYKEEPGDDSETRTFTSSPVQYGDIAILLERRTHLGLFIHSLAIRNIPYYVYKGSGFYNRQEILDLISLLSVLSRPYDDIHLIGLLRSPYIGLSDLEILRISRKHGDSFFEKLRSSGPDYPRIKHAFSLLSGWLEHAGRKRLVSLIRLILDESGVLAVYGGLAEGDQIISNIEKLLGIIRSREEGGRYHLPDLVNDLHDALDREEEEGEAMIDDPDMNAVTIMTIHAAKGLEFPVVFIPEMAAKPNMKQEPILMDSHRTLMGLVLPDPSKDFQPEKTPVYQILKKEFDEKLFSEKKRLLYVALTRSADLLIMSGEIGKDLPDGSQNTRLDWIISLAGITWNAVEEGEITLRTEDNREVLVRIIRPVPTDRECESGIPPFSIPDNLKDCPGKFVRKELKALIPPGVPFQVTEIARSISDLKSGHGIINGDGGPDFGSAVHEVLRGREPHSVIRENRIENGIQQQIIKTVYEEFWSLPILSDILEFKREYAFTVKISGFALTGRIDFLAKLPDDSWLVIDYKSEKIPAYDLVKNMSYCFQVEIYRRAAEILGLKPAHGALYSVHEKKLVKTDTWSDDEVIRRLKNYSTCIYSITGVSLHC